MKALGSSDSLALNTQAKAASPPQHPKGCADAKLKFGRYTGGKDAREFTPLVGEVT